MASLGFQAPLPEPNDPDVVADDVAGRVEVGGNGGYFRFSHVVGDGMGWQDGGFSSFGGWLPFTEFGSDTMLYGEARVFLSNDAYVGQNTGLGIRQYIPDWDRFIGGAVYYDYDHGPQRNGFGQITTSLETIGNFFDARINGYFPVSDSVRTLAGTGEVLDANPFYQGNRIYFGGQANFLEALQGGDAEIGVPLIQDTQWLRGYVGYYAYHSNSKKDVEGFRGRLEAQLSDDVSVQGIVTDDRTFGTLVNLAVDIRMGGGRPIRAFPSLSTQERMYLPVQRNWRIATNTYRAPIKVVARDIGDHTEIGVAWVDNSAAPGGDGTVENPFQTLAQAEAAAEVDLILVRQGVGPYEGGIALKDNQRLLGEGREHLFDAFAQFGDAKLEGTFNLPGFTNDPSLTPTLTNAGGDIVTLANNNEVSSFNLDSAGGRAVYGAGITNFDLNYLNIDAPALGGIVLNNAQGTGVIHDTTIDASLGDAIQVANVNAAPLSLSIYNMPSVTGNVRALAISADNSAIQASVDGYLSSGNQSGLDLSVANGGTLAALITDSTFDGSLSGDSVRLTAVDPNSVLAVQMSDTSAQGGFGNGLVVNSSNQGQVNAAITNGNFQNSGLDGVRVLADNSATNNTLSMTGTPANNAGVDGLHVELTNGSFFDIDVINGSFANAGQDAVDTTVDGGSTLNLFIDPTPLTNAGANGYRFAIANSSTANIDFIDAPLSFAGANGILGSLDNQSTMNLNLIRSAATNSTQDGMQVTAANNSAFNVNIEDSDFSNSGANGINLALSSGSTATLNNYAGSLSSANNGGSGLLLDLQSGATFNGILAGGNFSNNAVNAINATIDGGATSANLDLTNTVANNSGLDGFIFRVQNGGDLTATGTGGSFNDSGNHGIRGIIETGSSAALDFDGTSVANSGASGFYLDATGGSAFSAVFTNGSFTNSGINGASPDRNAIQITMDNSIGSLNLANTAGDNNNQNGLLLNLQNGAQLGANIVDGNFNNSAVNAIQANVSGVGTQAVLNMTNTTGNNAALDGLRFNVSNNGELIASATNGSFNNSGDSGVHGVLDNGGRATLNFSNVAVTNSNDNGLFVSSTNGSVFNGTFTNGSFANSGVDAGSLNRNAVELLVNGSTNNLTMTNTAGNNAGGDGLHFEVDNGGSLTGSISGGSFANAGNNAVEGRTSGGSVANVTLNGTNANNAGATGVLLNADSASELNLGFANSSISNAQGDGIELNADGLNTTASLTLNNATVNGNGLAAFVPRDGVNLEATAGAQVEVNLLQGTINGNRDNGIRASVAGAGSSIDFISNGATISNNLRGDGFGFDVTSGGTLTGVFDAGTIGNNGTLVAASGVRGNVNGLNSSADLTFNGTAVDNNRLDGFNMTSLNTGSLTLRLNDGVSASNNGRYGINFLVDGPNTVGNLLMTGDNIVSGNQSGGILFTASNGAQTTSSISGNVSNNGGRGVDVIGSNLTINSLTFSGRYDNNAAQGINIDLNNSVVNNFRIDTATITNNGAEGVRILASNGSQITNGLITNNTISNNDLDGILFSMTDSVATLFSIDNNLGINLNGGNGIQVALNNSPTSAFSITNNGGINDNAQNGVLFNLTNSDLTDVLVDSNAIQGNAAAGLQFTTTTSNVSGAITDNVITRNTLSGVGITSTGGPGATTIDFGNLAQNHSISGNTISENGNAGIGAGVLADVGENVNLIATLQNNTISDNQSFGVGITSTDGSVDLTVGGATAAEGNTFDQNVGAGLALTLQDASTGVVDIQNNVITGTVASNGTFQGDGINIRLRSTSILNPSTAQLTASVISNNVIGNAVDATQGNAGRGIVVTNDGNSVVDNLTLDGNVVANNAGDGIQFNKLGDANVTNVEISNSVITNNQGDGLEVVVANGNQTTTFDIHDNDITNNALNGVHLEVQADSRIDANLTNNLISGNTQNGILVTEQANDPTDQRNVTGVWIQNQILNNGGNGIALSGAYGIASPLVIGQNGFDMNGDTLGNLIDNNGGWGITSNAVGVAEINNNVITNNQAGGVQILSLVPFGNTITLDTNVISTNNGDGLELRATGSAFLSVTATGNSIVNNAGRGVDSLNQLNATTHLQFGDGTLAGGNRISNNLGEGFYVVNTSSGNQTQDVSASVALLADGALNVTPDMVLDLQFNEISNNGSPGTFPSSGLVLRVGTSNSAGANLTGNGTAGVGNAGLAGNGRVNARVVNNTFGGNFGSDVFVESFASTVDPTTTQGTWDDATFTITPGTLQRDPLARLNMVFSNNTGDALDVTRGEFDANAGNPSTGAFYDNDESVFKSRDVTQGTLSGGPFTNGARRRNAQRLASSVFPYSVPGFPGAAAGFAYDGVGSSTFRIESDFSVGGFITGDTFVGDLGPVPPPGNANGVPFSNPLLGEELPYGWDTTVAPGTFQFLIP